MASVKNIQGLVSHIESTIPEVEIVRVLWSRGRFYAWAVVGGREAGSRILCVSFDREWDAVEVESVGGTIGSHDADVTGLLRGVRDPLSRNRSEELTAALNMIGDYCSRNMMDGWRLKISVGNSDVSCDLEDPDGDEVDHWETDEPSPVVDACDYSQEHNDDYS